MASASKDTVYVDIDDEITSIIDKLKSSDKKIVALVLPKRSAVLQSIVNMKLLKRTADQSKKSIVLITSEVGLMPLAGAVGVHVAKTLQSKPAIPAGPKTSEESADDVEDVQLDANKPIGELAEEEAIEVDNEDKPEAVAAIAAKTKGKKKIKIPNFDKFRLKLVLGIFALILLIVGGYVTTQVMPKASIVIKTDSSTIDSQLDLTVSTTVTEVDETNTIVPGVVKELKKDDTETVPATGQIDKGTKATGTVTLKLTNCSTEEVTIPAGTGVTTNNLTFITKEAATLQSVKVGPTCKNADFPNVSTKKVSVTAQVAGDKYNLSGGRTFTVSGYPAVSGEDSSVMTGGTSNIVKVVSQKDIDDAKQKMQDRSDATRDELLGDMDQAGLIGLRETFAVKGTPVVNAVPAVNQEATEVKVTQSTIYTLLGAQKESLKKVIEKSVEGKIDTSKQVILDNGLEKAIVVLSEKKPNGDARINLKIQVLAGPQLDENAIKQEIAGKKKSQTISIIKGRPGIEDVQVTYSPFWVSSTPKKVNKITVVFEQKSGNDNQQ